MTSPNPFASLPPLREIIQNYQLSAQKKFGQNFILDLNLTRKIARYAAPLDECPIIEIGPGPGGLTRALLWEGALNVIAIEKDPRCLEALSGLKELAGDKLQIVLGDALEIDLEELCPGPKKIVANLPYNVSTPLLIDWLKKDNLRSMTLLFQKEVAERITATPFTKEYGRLSILCQLLTDPVILFDIPPQSFVPAPKVTSSLVHFKFKPHGLSLKKIGFIEKITQAAFGQRRKMLRQSLKACCFSPEDVLKSLHLDPTARAEELSPQDFLMLTHFLADTNF